MKGHAAHWGALIQPAGLSGKGQFQFTGRSNGVLKEHFIKVTDAVKQNLVGMLPFDFKILLHHGRHSLRVDFLCLLGNRLFCHASHSWFLMAWLPAQWQPPQVAQLPVQPPWGALTVMGSPPFMAVLMMASIWLTSASHSALAAL